MKYGNTHKDNPYYAYKHLLASDWLTVQDREAVECLFSWAKAQRDHTKSIRGELRQCKLGYRKRIARLEHKVKELENVYAATSN